HPLSAWLVSNEYARRVAVRIVRVRITPEAQLSAYQLDIRLLAGKKRPARPDVVFLCIGLEHLGRVMRGVDSDGVEENVLAYAVAQHLLHLHQARRLQRTGISARGIDQVNHHALALEHIVVEMDLLAVLRGQNNIRKIISAPA